MTGSSLYKVFYLTLFCLISIMVYNRGDKVQSSFFHRRGNWGTERWCALSPSHYKVVVSLAKAQTYSAPCTPPRIQHPCHFLVLSWAQFSLHTSVLKTWRFLLPFICPSPMVSWLPALENGSAAPSVMYLSLEPGGCCPLCVFTGDTITWGLCAIGVWVLLLPLTSSAIFWSTWMMSGIILNVRYCKVVVVYSLGGSCGQATFIHGALRFFPFPSSPPIHSRIPCVALLVLALTAKLFLVFYSKRAPDLSFLCLKPQLPVLAGSQLCGPMSPTDGVEDSESKIYRGPWYRHIRFSLLVSVYPPSSSNTPDFCLGMHPSFQPKHQWSRWSSAPYTRCRKQKERRGHVLVVPAQVSSFLLIGVASLRSEDIMRSHCLCPAPPPHTHTVWDLKIKPEAGGEWGRISSLREMGLPDRPKSPNQAFHKASLYPEFLWDVNQHFL